MLLRPVGTTLDEQIGEYVHDHESGILASLLLLSVFG
jgi:hypothetical protein